MEPPKDGSHRVTRVKYKKIKGGLRTKKEGRGEAVPKVLVRENLV